MGGADNMEKALAIYTRLRTWHAGGRINTPCNDKDIELTLGRHLQLMGGADESGTGPGYLYPAAHLACGGTDEHPL